jgi:Uma2 family endonuclease
MAATVSRPFDPLIDLDGLWTVELARRYLPIDGMPPVRYEAEEGRLIMSPRENSANSWAAGQLLLQLSTGARAAGYAVYNALSLRTDPKGWIEPDLVVLKAPVREQTWFEHDQVLCPVEIVSRSSRRRDRIDKPATCARLGIPYFMRVEILRGESVVEMLRLDDDRYVAHAKALSGQTFEITEPFAASFDPKVLLEP